MSSYPLINISGTNDAVMLEMTRGLLASDWQIRSTTLGKAIGIYDNNLDLYRFYIQNGSGIKATRR